MFDRIALINLDSRADRLGAFKAKIVNLPILKDYVRYRAVHGNTVTVPGFFVSGGGAWGCLLPQNRVQARVEKISKSRYAGECVEIVTGRGQRLALTTNHPVLTENGFVPAGKIKQGVKLVGYRPAVKRSATDNDVQDAPPRIEQVFDAGRRLSPHGRGKCRSPFEFYGDAASFEGQVEVVHIDRTLLHHGITFSPQEIEQHKLLRGNVQEVLTTPTGPAEPRLPHHSSAFFRVGNFGPTLFHDLGRVSQQHPGVQQHLLDPARSAALADRLPRRKSECPGQGGNRFPGLVPSNNLDFGGVRQRFGAKKSNGLGERTQNHPGTPQLVGQHAVPDAVLGGQLGHKLSVPVPFGNLVQVGNFGTTYRIGAASELDTRLHQPALDDVRAEAAFLVQLKDRFSSRILADEVVDVKFFHYDGPVYDFQTDTGYFVANSSENVSEYGCIVANCRQSHLRVLEDAMLDKVETLLVLEDDVRFVPKFHEKLLEFMGKVPDNWHGLMLGGQDIAPGSVATDVDGVARSRNTQRTHAYVVRGLQPMQDLYRLWARADRHIDHLFGQWQQKFNVYQPTPFLCGQDETPSDISGRNDTVRYWNANLEEEQADLPLTVLVADRPTVEGLRTLGFHFGYSRDALSGKDKGMLAMEKDKFPADALKKWADIIVGEACERGGVPGVWHPPTVTAEVLRARLTRPIREVKADRVEDALQQMPSLYPAYYASRVVWCWRGQGVEMLEGLRHHGWHRGDWTDPVSGLDNGVRQAVEVADKRGTFKTIVRQLEREISGKINGKMLVAHPDLDVRSLRDEFADRKVVELVGTDIGTLLTDYENHMTQALEMYGVGK